MGKHYIYRMNILENDTYKGVYIGQHKIGKKNPSCDGYKGSGSKWKKEILKNHIPVKKTILRVCECLDETNYWEEHYINEAIQNGEYLWNVAKGGGGHDSEKIYTDEEIREHDKKRFDKWYKENQGHILNYRKKYYAKNKKQLYAANRKRIERNKEKETEYHRKYYRQNKDRFAEQRKQYYEQNKDRFKEHRKEYGKRYRETHAEKLADKGKKYYAENKDKLSEYYGRLCCYNGEILTYRALTLRFCRKGISNPAITAKKYLIEKEK